jgi:ABC-type Mn2+/Zn2+ transport system permease subunit
MNLDWQTLQLFGFAIAAALVAGLVCPLVGGFLHLRRTSFYGIALPQFAAAGVACGFAVLPWWSEHIGLGGLTLDEALSGTHAVANYLFAWASVFTFGSLFAFAALNRRQGSESGRLAVGFALASAATILFTHWSPAGENFVTELLRGEILAVGQHEFETLAVVLGLVLATLFVFQRELVLVSYDREMAQVLGKHVRAHEFLLLVLTGATVSAGTLTVGPLVLFALLVIPPVAARLWSRSLRAYFVLAVVFGVASAALGAWGALSFDLPMASAIVAAAGALLGGAALARKFLPGRAS